MAQTNGDFPYFVDIVDLSQETVCNNHILQFLDLVHIIFSTE